MFGRAFIAHVNTQFAVRELLGRLPYGDLEDYMVRLEERYGEPVEPTELAYDDMEVVVEEVTALLSTGWRAHGGRG